VNGIARIVHERADLSRDYTKPDSLTFVGADRET
jgi:hypothetical protein